MGNYFLLKQIHQNSKEVMLHLSHDDDLLLSFPVMAVCTSQQSPPSASEGRGLTLHYNKAFWLEKKRKKEAVPDLNLPLQMEGVSTSRHAIGKSCSSIGGQVWSPMWWWGQWRTRESARGRKEPALRGRQLARSLSVSLPASVEKVCVSMCERSLNVRRREHSGACVNPR